MRKIFSTFWLCIFIIVYSANGSEIHFYATEILGRPTDHSVTVNAVVNCALEVFFEFGTESLIYTGHTDTRLFPVGVPVEMVLDNLVANTRYFYRMRYRQPGETQFSAGAEHKFHTQRPPGSCFKFAIQTDSHLYDKKCTPALYQISVQNELADAPDFLLDLGDTFGDDHDLTIGCDSLFQLYFAQRTYFDAICHSVPLFICLGNHEVEYSFFTDGTTENLAVWATRARQFYYPNPVPDDFYTGNSEVEAFVGQPENYYAWEWGDALFVVLDAYRYLTTSQKPREWDWTLGEPQFRWFQQTLENSRAKFKFVFIHHILGQTRGGIAWADKFEWGGLNQKGVWEFDTARPGWEKPIHQLMVDTGVTIFFQGHDHLLVKEERDGVIYQECPMPSDATYDVGAENEDDYPTSVIVKNSGHLRVTVTPDSVTVDYVRAFLPEDENATNQNGKVAYSYSVKPLSVTAIRESAVEASDFHLAQNYPNPFNPVTQIGFTLPRRTKVRLTIYNQTGQQVKIFSQQVRAAGQHDLFWDGTDGQGRAVAAGIYYYHFQADNFHATKKAILLK